MVEAIYTSDKQEESWDICFAPEIRTHIWLGLLILALMFCIWKCLCRYHSKMEESDLDPNPNPNPNSNPNPTLTSTPQPNYSSFAYTPYYQEVAEIQPSHTIIPINVKPMLEKRPSAVSYLSYAPSIWSLDNRILGQLNQLEQAQSYLFKSINILIDNQEELDEVEEFVGALSWGNDLTDLSKMQYVH